MTMGAPLEGLRVIELARVLAGPLAGQTLADLGADVIKVESPAGDDTRKWGPPFVDHDGERSAAYYHSANRGKRSIVIDFGTDAGLETLLELIATADVLIENFKLGSLEKHGLDYDSLHARFPGLVYCSITGFGHTGPYAHRAGYDYIIQGMAGLMSVTGSPEGQPQKTGIAITDILTGVYAVGGILAALRVKDATGVGQHVDMSLMDTGVSVMTNQAMNYLTTGQAPKKLGNMHPNLTPYQVFDCADGWIIIATGNDGQYAKLCDLLGLHDMIDDPKFATNAARLQNRDEMTERLTGQSSQWTKAALLAGCEQHGVPAGPINDMADVFADPQVKARGLELQLDGVPGVRSPFVFSESSLALGKASPRLGEDTAAILAGLQARRAPKPT